MKILTFFITVISTITGIISCPDNCRCQVGKLRCHRKAAPTVIPDATTEVYMNGFNLVPHNVTPFQHKSWGNVLKLDIIVDYPKDILYLADGIFTGLHNLTYLGFHGIKTDNVMGSQTFETSRGSLNGIEQVITLNLSGNEAFRQDQCVILLESNNSVPKLNNLILTNLDTKSDKHIPFGRFVSSALKGKPIKTLILDNTSVSLDLKRMSVICSTIETLSLKYTTLSDVVSRGNWNFSCQSLKFLDVTNANNPYFRTALAITFKEDSLRKEKFNNNHMFLLTLQKLYLNHISNSFPTRFDNGLKFNATEVIWKIQILQFRRNMFQWFNASISNPNIVPNTEIDVSYNELGYIHPKSMNPGNNVVKLDLSNNKLFAMETKFSDDFAVFLNTFLDLVDINLASNNLSKIPSQMFAKNPKLRKINLSKNNLITFSFDIANLINLEYINLAGNKMINIDMPNIHMINNFITRNGIVNHNKTTKINLGDNNFVCSCKDFEFMEWVKNSNFLVEKEDPYLCTFEHEHFNLKTKNAYIHTLNICDHRKRVKSAIIASITLSVSLVTFIIAIYIIRKRLVKQAIIDKGIKQIKEGQLGERFLVFLSHSSEDGDFALEHVYPQLNKELSALTGNRYNYVCTGEKNFRPGFSIISEIMVCLSKSAVVVCLVSRSFCEKGWCKTELDEALAQGKTVILLFMEEIPKDIMTPVLKTIFQRNIRSKVELGDDGKCVSTPSWSVLCSSILQLAAVALQDIETSPDDVNKDMALEQL